MKPKTSILEQLNQLKIRHETSKVNSSVFQPNEKDQQILIARNSAAKLVAGEMRKETQKYIYNETMRLHEAKRLATDDESDNASQNSMSSANRAQTAPSLSSHKKKSRSTRNILNQESHLDYKLSNLSK